LGAGFRGNPCGHSSSVIFQPELRSAFMRLDSALRYWPRSPSAQSKSNRAIADAMFDLARDSVGALLVIVRRDAIFELVEGGVSLGAAVSAELLVAIFSEGLAGTMSPASTERGIARAWEWLNAAMRS
jgi:DNA integrity scanning protein DisA with diadenylate cyclase activity